MKTLQEVFSFEQFDNLEWVSKQVVEGFITGQHKSPYHGFSVEFAEHRLYNQGESTKHIDWKLFARTERLFVKRYEEETNLRCMLLLDSSSSMLFPFDNKSNVNKLSFSIYSAAALSYLLRRQRDAVGLSYFSDNLEFQSEIKLSELHAKLIYSELNKLLNRNKKHLNKTTSTAQALHQIADKLHKRSLVILFTDLLSTTKEELFSALEHLKYNKHELIIYHISDKHYELDLDFENRPTRFIDLESGTELKLNPEQIKNKYKEYMQSFMHDLKIKCTQYQIELVEADVNTDFRDVLIPFLSKRKLLY